MLQKKTDALASFFCKLPSINNLIIIFQLKLRVNNNCTYITQVREKALL